MLALIIKTRREVPSLDSKVKIQTEGKIKYYNQRDDPEEEETVSAVQVRRSSRRKQTETLLKGDVCS